jgi:membrane protein YdbS with pleckstrin-like domain
MLRWLGNLRRRFFPLPHEIIEEHLGREEGVLYQDRPSFKAFLIENWWLLLLIVAAAVLFFLSARNGGARGTTFLFLLGVFLLMWLVVKRLGELYTSYVITNVRIMRLSGILNRLVASIPLGKVTDLSFKQGPIGRIMGFATVRIESANEESGLKDLSDLTNPVEFNHFLLEILIAKQGKIALPGTVAGTPPPVGAGWYDAGRAPTPEAYSPVQTLTRPWRRREREAPSAPPPPPPAAPPPAPGNAGQGSDDVIDD